MVLFNPIKHLKCTVCFFAYLIKDCACKILQRGDWAGALDSEKVPLLLAEKKKLKGSVLKVLDF